MTTWKNFSEPLPPLIIPSPSRPAMPKDYGVPAGKQGMLSWDWVSEHMTNAMLYWLGTSNSNMRPHLMPNWGAWVDNYFLFNTDPSTRKGRNLHHDAHISVGIQDGQHAVIIEGLAAGTTNKALLIRLDDEYERKYGMREGRDGAFVVLPRKVFAFGDWPHSPTRWIFEPA